MPSFDVVSELDSHEVTNAVDQANRELEQRFDFRNAKASYARDEKDGFAVLMKAQAEYQLKQMLDILTMRLSKRGIDPRCVDAQDAEANIAEARQTVKLRHGIEQDTAKQLIKQIKDSKLKVQAQIQGEKLRVTGKSRDDLQATIALLRKADVDVPLQFENFRD